MQFRKHTSILLSFLTAAACAGFGGAAWADESIVDKADLAKDKGNYDEAIQLYKRAAATEPNASVHANNKLWKLYVKLNRYDDAVQVLQELYSKTKDKTFRTYLGDVYRLSGNFYAAQRVYDERLADDPNDQEAMIGAGECLESTSNFDAARDYYRRAAAIDGPFTSTAEQKLTRMKDARAVVAIDADAEIGRWPVDRMPLKVYISDPKPDTPGYRSHLRAFASQAIVDWNNATHGLVRLQENTNDPDNADIIIGWAEHVPGALGVTRPQLAPDGRLARAIIVLACNSDAHGRSLPPESPATRAMWEARDRFMREVCLHELGHALGLDHSPRSTDIMANGVFGMNSADVQSSRGLQQGDIERLCQLYSSGDTPREKELAALLAKMKAGQAAQAALSANPSTTQPATAGGDQSFNSTTSRPATISSATATLMRDVIFNLGAGNYPACLTQLKKLVTEEPRNAQAHYLMAVTLVNMRQYGDAAKQYNEVLRLVPQGKLADLAHFGLSKISK